MKQQVLAEKAAELVNKSTNAQIKISAAESCTGGLVASSIVSISGASNVFAGSAVCYQNISKNEILKVSKYTLKNHFAESKECAEEMAKGALEIFHADLSIATTGFLDSNVSDKPVELAGQVFLCTCKKSKNGELSFNNRTVLLNPLEERNANRAEIVGVALDMLLSQI